MQEFKAKMDRDTKVLTWIVTGIVTLSIIPLLFLPGLSWGRWVLSGFLLGTLFLAYLFRPVKYKVDSEQVLIQTGIGEKKLPISNISDVRQVTKKELGNGIRTFGVGGFFGYYGRFYYSGIGSVTAYVTDPGKVLLIQTGDNKKYLVSPDDMLGFMEALGLPGLSIHTVPADKNH